MTKNIQDLKNTLILDAKQSFLDNLIEAGVSETLATETANLYTNMFIDFIDTMTKEWSEKIQESSVEEAYDELANEVAEFSKTIEKETNGLITAKTFKMIFFAALNTLRDEHYEESRKANAEEVMKYFVNKPIAMKKYPHLSFIDNPPEKVNGNFDVSMVGLSTRQRKQNAKIFKQAAKQYLKDKAKFEGLEATSDKGREGLTKATIGNLTGIDMYETKDGFYCDVIFKDGFTLGTAVADPAKTGQEALYTGMIIVAGAIKNSKNKFSLFN